MLTNLPAEAEFEFKEQKTGDESSDEEDSYMLLKGIRICFQGPSQTHDMNLRLQADIKVANISKIEIKAEESKIVFLIYSHTPCPVFYKGSQTLSPFNMGQQGANQYLNYWNLNQVFCLAFDAQNKLIQDFCWILFQQKKKILVTFDESMVSMLSNNDAKTRLN